MLIVNLQFLSSHSKVYKNNKPIQLKTQYLEHCRLRRPERFFAVVAHGAFPQEMHHAQQLQKDTTEALPLSARGNAPCATTAKGMRRGRASACSGLLTT